jgi:hypothetical protein
MRYSNESPEGESLPFEPLVLPGIPEPSGQFTDEGFKQKAQKPSKEKEDGKRH